MVLLTINGVQMPPPSHYSIQLSDLSGSGATRSLNGVLHTDVIRAGVVKIFVEWELIDYQKLTLICNNIASASFSVSYFDGSNTLKQITAYAGDKTLDSVCINPNNLTDNRWNLKFNIIEI